MDRPLTGPSSASHQPSPADQIALDGPSALPDPLTHAYRKDLADRALATRLISSHYADPVERKLRGATALRATPSEDGEIIALLSADDRVRMLEAKLGWAWGYTGPEQLVGYVAEAALA